MRACILILLAILLADPHQAQAHALLDRAQPRVGSTVATAPTELRLRFSEAAEPSFSRITLAKKDGETIALDPVVRDPDDERTLVVPIPVALAPGTYRVSWRAVSRDTHITTGDFSFQVGE